MKIQWLGHSCFLLTSDAGVRIVTDPFNPEIGYPAPAVEADIVTESHQHDDHNFAQVVKGKFTVIDKPGKTTLHGIEILGVPTFHDEEGGKKRGKNIIFCFTIDGLKMVHCGDLGHALTAEQAQAIGPVDVLQIPVGGHYTIDAVTAVQVMQQLQPKLTVPMHFKTSVLNFPIAPVDVFLKAAGGGKHQGAQAIQVSAEDVRAAAPGVVVLDFPK